MENRKIFTILMSVIILCMGVSYANAERGILSLENSSLLEENKKIEDDNSVYRRIVLNSPLRSGDPENLDLPNTVEFHVMNNKILGYRLYENSGDYGNPNNQSDLYGICGGRFYNLDEKTGDYYRDSIGTPGNVISYLGINLNAQYGETTNYAIYLDTAFINRGTGWIKAQYMIAVDPYIPEESDGCNLETGEMEYANDEYVMGRYLFNTSMYAKVVCDSVRAGDGSWIYADKFYDKDKGEGIAISDGSYASGYMYRRDNFNKVQPVKDKDIKENNGDAYLSNGFWERLAFSWAIHKGDSLYVLKGVGLEPTYKGAKDDPHQVWLTLTKEYGVEGVNVNFARLISENIVPGSAYQEAYYPMGDGGYPEMRTYYDFKPATALSAGKSIGLHAIIALDDNTHKDWVFSFRYIEKGADDFVIESETTDRNTSRSAMIAPGYGGWINHQNGIPQISRSNVSQLMAEACVFNVNWLSNSVSNEAVVQGDDTSKAVIVGGRGSVTILNAAGKKVVIRDILGRTTTNATVSSDNASFIVPAGVVVVAVEGEKVVKTVVK